MPKTGSLRSEDAGNGAHQFFKDTVSAGGFRFAYHQQIGAPIADIGQLQNEILGGVQTFAAARTAAQQAIAAPCAVGLGEHPIESDYGFRHTHTV